MKTLATIICGIALFVLGAAVIHSATDISPGMNTGYKTMAAATLDLSKMQIPRDLLLDATKSNQPDDKTPTVQVSFDSLLVDSLHKRVQMLEKRPVTVTKWRKSPPKTIIKTVHDTIINTVPVYYVTKEVSNKEGPEGCRSVYEVRHVEDICPDKLE
jgi:hypothetical protein